MKWCLLILILTGANTGVCKAQAYTESRETVGAKTGQRAASSAKTGGALSGDGETFGEERPDASGTVREISDRFGHDELQRLYQLLNSDQFQAPLTNYNCGEPVPRLAFSVSLRPKAFATTRAVEIYHSPGLSPSGHTRCLLFGVDYLLDKAVAKLDPDPKEESTREPHCDCSKRDSNEEWVTFPGPDEILAPAKVEAKDAARRADEAEEQKAENLGLVHLELAGVQIQPDATTEHLITRETSVGELPAAADMQLLAIAPNFVHYAYAVKRGGKQLVVLDGVEGKEYDEIPEHQRFAFSADGKHFAYIASRSGQMMVVADGKEGKPYKSIEELFHPIFSPDGKRLAYIAREPAPGFLDQKMFTVLDGQELKRYGLVEGLLFSPDSRHLAYNADKQWNRGTVVVLDGTEGKMYDQISSKCFSPNGSRLAYETYSRRNEGPGVCCFVVDGKEGKPYEAVSQLQFSPDSKHLVYVAGTGSNGKRILVRDDIETKYANLQLGEFSPDSKHLASVGRFGTNWLVLIDGKKLDPQEPLASGEMSFSPVRDLTFSPNSHHLAYIVRGPGTNWSVILDGTLIKSYEGIALSPHFTPDSKRLAYVMKRGGKSVLILSGFEGDEYDDFLTWRSGSEEDAKTIGLAFDERGMLHALALRGREVLRLEIELTNN